MKGWLRELLKKDLPMSNTRTSEGIMADRVDEGQGATREGLQELQALSEAATEGPWTLDGLGRYMVAQDRFGISVYSYHYPEPTSANAAFIVAAVNFVRALPSGSEATTASLDSGGTSSDDEIVTYVLRFGGRCRDCADEAGVCPGSGLPCDGGDKAVRHVLKALRYGMAHGYLSGALAQEKASEAPPSLPQDPPPSPPVASVTGEGWQPIETAPHDASRILIYTPGSPDGYTLSRVREGWWAMPYEAAPDAQCWWQTMDHRVYTLGLPTDPTHWQPLPSPPPAASFTHGK